MSRFLILHLICLTGCFGQNYQNYKEFILKSEGWRNKTYVCSKGFKTVGIGHKFEAGERVKSFYSNQEVNNFFKQDLDEALRAAQVNFPSFSRQPYQIKLVLVSLCFNLGNNGISKFVKFRRAINNQNYTLAGSELKNSLWYKQVTGRANKYISIIQGVK